MRRLLLACASIALIACGGSDSTGPAAKAEGTWNLSTINGRALPITLGTDQSGATVEILDDQYILNADGTWTESFTTRATQGTTVTTTPDTDTGTWTLQGNQVEITTTGGDSFTGTISNNSITIGSQYGPVVYVRQ